jgi:hypothetical protein
LADPALAAAVSTGTEEEGTMSTRAQRFAVSHRARSKFARRGLRSYFEYRDLGSARATRGKVVAPADFATFDARPPAPARKRRTR